MRSQSNPPALSSSGQDAALPASDLRVLPRDLGSLFAQRPLIAGESEDEYDELLSRVTSAVAPADVIEAMWVKDIVDLMWESQRLRRLKASLLMVARKKAIDHLSELAEGRMGGMPTGFFSGFGSGEPKKFVQSMEEAERKLMKNGLDMNSIMAQALSDRLGDVERIDRMIASADARRNKVLAEIDRRREALARRLRAVSTDVTDLA
jgi:hypothetical protein